VPFVASPFIGGGFASPPRIAVIHFTGGGSAMSSANWFADRSRPPATGSSAHVVIDRDGSIVQCVAIDRIAWHAGRSNWKGIVGLNPHSIGIELANYGNLHAVGGNWCGPGDKKVANPVMASHRNGNPDGSRHPIGWEAYPAAQINATVELMQLLVSLGVNEAVGHDDIAPVRKSDPGPAFDMTLFRSRVFGGRRDNGDNVKIVLPAAGLYLRAGPDGAAAKLREAPYAKGTLVRPLRIDGDWLEVSVLANGAPVATGWMRSIYLGEPTESVEESVPLHDFAEDAGGVPAPIPRRRRKKGEGVG
jgi:N-acetylmuramoyl-L-alanine amidase